MSNIRHALNENIRPETNLSKDEEEDLRRVASELRMAVSTLQTKTDSILTEMRQAFQTITDRMNKQDDLINKIMEQIKRIGSDGNNNSSRSTSPET